MTESMGQSLIDIPKMFLLYSRSQICIFGVVQNVSTDALSMLNPVQREIKKKKKPHSTSLFRVCFENGKHYLKGHPISSSRWMGKKTLVFTNNLIEFSLPFLQAIQDIF